MGTRATLGGETGPSGVYEASEIRASIEATGPRDTGESYTIRMHGPVRRVSDEAPPAAINSRLRVRRMLDAQGYPMTPTPVTGDEEAWRVNPRFRARPPLVLQGWGEVGPFASDVLDGKRVEGVAEAWEFSRLACLRLDLDEVETPMEFVEISDGAWVALRAFEQRGRRVTLDIWTFVSNAEGGERVPVLDPRRALNEYVVDGDGGPYGYDESRAPFLLGFEMLDRHGCVLAREQPWGGGTDEAEGQYFEMDTTLELDVEGEVVAVNVVVATEARVVEVPFEADLRIWVRDARGVISGEDPREK